MITALRLWLLSWRLRGLREEADYDKSLGLQYLAKSKKLERRADEIDAEIGLLELRNAVRGLNR